MAEAVTEIVFIPLKPGTDLQAGDAKEVWDATLKAMGTQTGAKSLFWGRQLEDKDMVQVLVGWESMDAHIAFTKKPEYATFMERLASIMGGAPFLFHARLPTDEASLRSLRAAVTECVTAYFPPSQSEAEYSANFFTFRTECEKIPNSGVVGMMGGWSVESHQYESKEEGKEVEGKAFAAFIGWPNVDAHLKFRQTEDFGKIIGYLRGGTKAIKMRHVVFQQYM